MTFLADSFRQVDNAANLAKLETCLSLMERLPDFQTYKKTSYEALRPWTGRQSRGSRLRARVRPPPVEAAWYQAAA